MEKGDSTSYELHPTDKLIDESDVLAHQALSRILELVRSEPNSDTRVLTEL